MQSYSLYILCTCSVHVLCILCAYAVHALCMLCAYSVHALCMLCACSVHALCILCAYAVHALCILCAYSVHALCMLCACSVHALCMLCACSVHALCILCAYSVHTLCILYPCANPPGAALNYSLDIVYSSTRYLVENVQSPFLLNFAPLGKSLSLFLRARNSHGNGPYSVFNISVPKELLLPGQRLVKIRNEYFLQYLEAPLQPINASETSFTGKN